MADVSVSMDLNLNKSNVANAGQMLAKSLTDALSRTGLVNTGAIQTGTNIASAIGGTVATGALLATGVAAVQFIADALADFPIITAIMKLLKMMVMLLFLPLVPILKPVLELLSGYIKVAMPWMKLWTEGISAIMDFFTGDFSGAFEHLFNLKGLADNVWNAIVDVTTKIATHWLDAGLFIWDNIIKPAFEVLSPIGTWIWEDILKPAWDTLSNVGNNIWNWILKPAWESLLDVGKWVWDILKAPWDWLAQQIYNIFPWLKPSTTATTTSGPATVTSQEPTRTIGSGTVKTYIGGGSTQTKATGLGSAVVNITVTNPTVSSTADIKRLSTSLGAIAQEGFRRATSYL